MPTRRDLLVGLLTAVVAVAATLGFLSLHGASRGEKERTMTPNESADVDLVTLPSAHKTAETAERLKALLAKKMIEVFADIDHAAGAKTVGMDLRPTRLLIFGNPKAGTPLMQSRQTLGLDLPLRVVIWEDEAGKTWLTYHRLEYVAQRHHVVGHDEAVQNLGAGLAALAGAAAAP